MRRMVFALVFPLCFGCLERSGPAGPKGGHGPRGGEGATCVVEPNDNIQNCIDSVLNDGGGLVFVRAGAYTVSRYIHIWGNNLVLQGAGPATKIRVANGAQTSGVVVGPVSPMNPDEDPSGKPVENVVIRDLIIDGNKEGQSDESWRRPLDYIMVSGITIRYAKNVTVDNVTVINGRSAGILVEKSTDGFLLDNVNLEQSAFDGFSCNKSRHGNVTNSRFRKNLLAGITATCDCSDNIFSNNDISSNGLGSQKAPGIFLADAHGNQFSGNVIEGNGDTGITLTGPDCNVTKTGASLNYFSSNKIAANRSCGVYLHPKGGSGGPGGGNIAGSTFYHANTYNGVCARDSSLYRELNPIVEP